MFMPSPYHAPAGSRPSTLTVAASLHEYIFYDLILTAAPSCFRLAMNRARPTCAGDLRTSVRWEIDMRRWRLGRRGRTALLGGLALVLALAGCGGGDHSANTGTERKPGQKIQLVFWSWVPGVDKAVNLWNSQNPDVQVKLENIPAGSSGGYAKMHAALQAGKGAPDLAQVEYQNIPEFLLDGGLVDLSKYGV